VNRQERLAALGHGLLLGDGVGAEAALAAEGSAEENERAVQAIQREEEGHDAGMVKFVQKLVGGTCVLFERKRKRKRKRGVAGEGGPLETDLHAHTLTQHTRPADAHAPAHGVRHRQ